MTDHRKPKDRPRRAADSQASEASARPMTQGDMYAYPTEPERASDGIDDAIQMLQSMTDATWQAHRDAALARLQRAHELVDRNILRNLECP